MNGAQELDEQFSADIMAAVEDISTVNGNGIAKGFIKAIKTYKKISHFEIPDEKTILHNVKVHLPEILRDIARLKKDVFSKDYMAAAEILGEMFKIISQPIPPNFVEIIEEF